MRRCIGILAALLIFTLGISEFVPETEIFEQIMKPKWVYYIYSKGYPEYYHGEQRRKFIGIIPTSALRAEKRGEINVSCSDIDFPDYEGCPANNVSSITINVFKEEEDKLFTTYMCGETEASYNTERIEIDWNTTKTRGRFSCTLIADYKPDPDLEYTIDHQSNLNRFKTRPPPPPNCECGKENAPKNNEFGFFGYEAGTNQYPFMAALVQYKGSKSKFFCGASIISPRYALSSAQCKYYNDEDKGDLRLRVGDHNNKIECETKHTATYILASMVPHEQWAYDTAYFNDIMLVKTKDLIKFGYGVGAVCLPYSGDSYYTEWGVRILGWGSNLDNQYPDVLKIIGTKVTTDCNRPTTEYINKRRLCTHNQTIPYHKHGMDIYYGTCTGDTGDPLIGIDNHLGIRRHYLIGILTLQGCNNTKVEVFTRVLHYLDWIITALEGDIYCKTQST